MQHAWWSIFSGTCSTLRPLAALAATAMFCMAASAVYIINDVADRQKDRHNPRKAHRPIASGSLSIPVALAAVCSLAVAGLLAFRLGATCTTLLGLYLVLNLAYSFHLKHAVLADVMTIALGFVFRVLAGVLCRRRGTYRLDRAVRLLPGIVPRFCQAAGRID